jgi:enoyl-CoA hydratase/carnithine racemase
LNQHLIICLESIIPMTYETILTETPIPGVGVIRFNRPQALNALNNQLVQETFDALEAFDRDDSIGCIVLTGSDRAFCAGADIKQVESTAALRSAGNQTGDFARRRRHPTPHAGSWQGSRHGGDDRGSHTHSGRSAARRLGQPCVSG